MPSSLAEALASALNAGPPRIGPIVTISQFEEKHPATKNRMRGWIMRADLNIPDFGGLSEAVIRVGRCVMLDEAAALQWLESRKHQPKSRARNPHGCKGLPHHAKKGAR